MVSLPELSLPQVIRVVGALQLCILIASAMVPTQLDWKESLRRLPPLLRQMFWTYGIYTAAAILSLGLFSLFGSEDLATGGRLARLVCGANCLFWGVRLALQGVFDAKPFLTRWWLTAGYHLLTVLFLLFTAFYGWLTLR